MTSAENDQRKSIKWLLANGADPNLTMNNGWTAAHAAAKQGHSEVLKMLLDGGANKDIKAIHRDFGRNLTVADVAKDYSILKLLS